MKKRIIKYLIDKAKRSKLIQSVFEQPIDLKTFDIKGKFIDNKKNEHLLYEGLRTKIKPGWERIFRQNTTLFDKSPQKITNIAVNGTIAVDRIEPVINIFTKGIKESNILEIGCSAGGSSFAFAQKKAKEVVATEFSGYKIKSVNNKSVETEDLNEVNENLKELRSLVKAKFNDASRVKFIDDDICNTNLKPETFDLICSWDVLEHLHDPLSALKNMRKLLKNNGIAIHEYNPFFSLTGGHSACTIDFPWGHVILDNNDFARFNTEIQPEKADIAMSFYNNGINRMTIHDLKSYSNTAGFEILSLIEYPKEQHLRMMNKSILEMAKANYPTVTLNDLITTKIIVVLKKIK